MTQLKCVIFDLDGVLIDSKLIHFNALNNALAGIDEKFVISLADHATHYDGLSTQKKLEKITLEKDLDPKFYEDIINQKQLETVKMYQEISEDKDLVKLFKKLIDNNVVIAVASNSIRKTLRLALIKLGIIEYIEIYLSNQDVKFPKPNPEIYWECMKRLGVHPRNTVIFEDSHIGREAASASGAKLIEIESRIDLTEQKIDECLSYFKISKSEKSTWVNKQMNILIPMAGEGKRFEVAGYSFPKPLIEVDGKPMIQAVIENLHIDAHYIFIVQRSHYEKFHLKYLLNLISPGCDIVQVESKTDGAASTALLAKLLIDNDLPLLIANSDQLVEWNSGQTLYSFQSESIDGAILVFESTHPKWSYVKVSENGLITEVAEKKVISNIATVGIYYWKRGSDFVKFANQMIEKNIRTNNEFYICPVFNEAIESGLRIRPFFVEKMWGIGTPEDLNTYLNIKGQ